MGGGSRARKPEPVEPQIGIHWMKPPSPTFVFALLYRRPLALTLNHVLFIYVSSVDNVLLLIMFTYRRLRVKYTVHCGSVYGSQLRINTVILLPATVSGSHIRSFSRLLDNSSARLLMKGSQII